MSVSTKIAFIILTHNSNQYIYNCLDSVFSISSVPIFVSVFDNGSTDGTVEILKNYQKEKSNLAITYSSKNIGTTISRNTAFKLIPKDFNIICILDSDTLLLDKNEFLNMADYLLAHSNIGAVGPRLIDSKGKIQNSGRYIPSLKTKLLKISPFKKRREKGERKEIIRFTPLSRKVIDVGYLMSACILVKREIFNKIGGFDQKIFYAPEDIDFCVKIEKLGFRVSYFMDCTIIHYWQRLSRKKLISKVNFFHLQGLLYFFRKYHTSELKKINEKVDYANNS